MNRRPAQHHHGLAGRARGEPALGVLTAYPDALKAGGFTFERDYLSE